MNFVGGGLKLKGKGNTTNPLKPVPGAQLLDKRPKAYEVEESDPKPEKKVKTVVAPKPSEKESETTEKVEAKEPTEEYKKAILEKNWKTDYEKRVALQKQQKLKGKIEQKLKTSHR